jgi:3-isopropylmalate/(R)-2-methylmalate dehydratase small subunit
MQPFKTHTGIVAPLDAMHVDTDQIMPKQWLKRIERTGYESYVFSDWRFNEDGTPKADFEMNAPRYAGATILLARDNFGCGSSREHAVWGLENYGIRAVIAPSFADIFYNNCFNNGLLPIALPHETVSRLFAEVRATDGYKLTIDLAQQTIAKPDGATIPFELDAFRKHCLLEGLDKIGLTLLNEDRIAQYEKAHGIA